MRLLIKKYLKFCRRVPATIRYVFETPRIPHEFQHQNVPYFSQWESPELNKSILKGTLLAGDDPRWRKSGALNKDEYTAWSWSGCGLACLKMILAHRCDLVIPLVTLGKSSLKYGCYDLPLERSVGLRYQPFTAFLKKAFNFESKAISSLSIPQIIIELSRGRYIMASVHPSIRQPASPEPKNKGGHLVLITGYSLSMKCIYLHNPSGTSITSQQYAQVSFSEFKKFFNYQGMVIC